MTQSIYEKYLQWAGRNGRVYTFRAWDELESLSEIARVMFYEHEDHGFEGN